MEVTDKLKAQGWFLTEEAILQIGENGNITDVKQIIRKALDYDLREVAAGAFPEDINKGKLESIPGKIVVQVQKIRNVSAPKANEESRAAPRMLKLTLTDGQTSCQAVEVEHIQAISLNTPPGTKLYLKSESVPMAHGFLLLKSVYVDVLGGKVAPLVEKWELNRSLAKHIRGRIGEEGGPPPWIPFGQKILRSNPQDRNFKSLDSNRDKENKENAEFEAQRKDAIAEAARGGAKKIFGGGHKPLLDHNVQQIVDYGFTVEQAEYALRQNRNNVDRALRALQKRDEGSKRDDRNRTDAKPKEEQRERRKRGEREDETGVPPKPSGSVSLFDFVQNKLPIQNEKETDNKFGSTTGERKSTPSETSNKSGANTRASRSERGNFNQTRGGSGGSRGGGKSSRGGRGGASSSSWSGNESGRDRDKGGSTSGGSGGMSAYHHNNPAHRDERGDRGRHSTSMGGGSTGSSSSQQQQKPPRFQNQQRFQQQQQQQQQQQLHQNPPTADIYGQQNWSNSYNDSNYGGTWPGRNCTPGSVTRPRDEYVTPNNNHRDAYGAVTSSYDTSRNKPSRQQQQQQSSRAYSNSFENPLELRSTRAPAARYEGVGNGRNFGQQQDLSSSKFNSHQDNLSRDSFSNFSRPQNNHLYTMDFSYKESPNLNNSSQAVSNLTSSSPYNSGIYSSQTSYGGMIPSDGPPSNQYIPDSKSWQWHKGDKCMAKYWEDNMYYNAEVTGVSERTCVVRFVEYGNFEEVLQDDCIPFTEDGLGHSIQTSSAFLNSTDSMQSPSFGQNHFSGILEFRRGGTRPYIKSGNNSGGTNGSEGTVTRDRRPPRIQQQMYVPPAQRKQ